MKREEKDKKTEPEFIVVEEDTSYLRRIPYPDPEGIIWGIVIIFAGLLLLLNVFNVVPWNIWSYLLRFWPILIIIAGFQMLLGNHIISRIFLSIIIFVLFSWVLLISIHELAPHLLKSVPANMLYPIKWWEVIQK